MRIGPFSELFGMSPETVRFYVNKGLLVPLIRQGRYIFSPQDVEDMELLLKLKALRFSLAEIHRVLSLKRLSNFDSPEELNDYISILKIQKEAMQQEKSHVEQIIAKLNHEIGHASGKHTGNKRICGVPLVFLPYLACPHCQKGLNISDCNIEKDQIMAGTLLCSCGYRAQIQNGIIIGDPGEINAYDGPDLDRYCYRMMSPPLITLMKKNYQWMLERLGKYDTKGKIILEDFINDYCFCHANFESMSPDALYIVTDKFPEIVAMYKELIEKMNLPHQILYIAAGSHLLPLRKNCIDIYIDSGANECAMFQPYYSMAALAPYFHSQSRAIGFFWHFAPECLSLQEMKNHYPNSWEYNFNIRYFQQYLQENWQHIIDFEELGYVTDSGGEDSFSYHIPGEKLQLQMYFAEKFIK